MASQKYEIRWINESKRYGLFASENIEAGTMIIREPALIINIYTLIGAIHHCKTMGMQRVFLSLRDQQDLEVTIKKIVNGMHQLRCITENKQEYEPAMEIHQKRVIDGEVFEPEAATVLELPMELYKRISKESGIEADDDAEAALRSSLEQVNTCLQGATIVEFPQLHVWGPYVSFINHACRPNALVSNHIHQCSDEEVAADGDVYLVAMHALSRISKGQEITIEYEPVFGAVAQRGERLGKHGISKCICVDCEEEEDLARQAATNIMAREDHDYFTQINSALYGFWTVTYPALFNRTPAAFFQALQSVLSLLKAIKYRGWLVRELWAQAIVCATHYNDNVRMYWFCTQILGHLQDGFGEDHPVCGDYRSKLRESVQGKVWNQDFAEYLTVCNGYPLRNEDAPLIFMVNESVGSNKYHLLGVNESGRLEPDNREIDTVDASEAVETASSAASTIDGNEEGEDNEQEEPRMTAEEADRNAREVIEEEKAKAAKKEKTKQKRKAKEQRRKERKRQTVLADTAVPADTDSPSEDSTAAAARLAARRAAVMTATTVPALPLPPQAHSEDTPATATVAPPPPPSPQQILSSTSIPRSRFRSDSAPESLVVARFLEGTPLRDPPSAFRDVDCVSDDGLEIRFGVSIREN